MRNALRQVAAVGQGWQSRRKINRLRATLDPVRLASSDLRQAPGDDITRLDRIAALLTSWPESVGSADLDASSEEIGESSAAHLPSRRESSLQRRVDSRGISDVWIKRRGRVHGLRITVVQQRTRCRSMKADQAAIGPEATTEGASVSSDRRAQRGSRCVGQDEDPNREGTLFASSAVRVLRKIAQPALGGGYAPSGGRDSHAPFTSVSPAPS
jgi:hypothetical protein